MRTDRIRTQGYALDDDAYFTGVRCLAASVFNALGEVTAAIGITGPTANFTKQRVGEMAQ